MDGLTKFYAQGRKDGDFESGIRMALQAMLASPRFLFRLEEVPTALRAGARLLFVPFGTAAAATPVRMVNVKPGNATVPRGGALEVSAALVGFAADGAEIVFRSDSASAWVRLPMARDADSTGFRTRLFDLTKPTEYYIESADVRSPSTLPYLPFSADLVAPNVLSNFFSRSVSLKCVGALNES